MAGRKAALPSPGLAFALDTSLRGYAGVTLTLEDNPQYILDLSSLKLSEGLSRDLAMGFLTWTSSSKGGRRVESVRAMRRGISSFARWLNLQSGPRVNTLSDISPFHLRMFREALLSSKARTTAVGYFGDLQTLLRHAPAVTAATRREASKRTDNVKATTPIVRYSPSDFTKIRNAARRTLEKAHARIHRAHMEALDYFSGESADLDRGRALYEVLSLGKPQSRLSYSALGAWNAGAWGLDSVARRTLFLDGHEVLAAAVLLACRRGLNLSPIATSGVPIDHDELIQLDMDKPRRGPLQRFWPELIPDLNDVDDDEGTNYAKAVRMVAEATEPARTWLAMNGATSGRLLIWWGSTRSRPDLGIPCRRGGTSARRSVPWLPEGTILDFRRLRRSVPNEGVSKEPTDHDPDTYLAYVRSDPVALEEHQLAASQGIQDAMDLARQVVHSRAYAGRDSGEANDALVVNCEDPGSKPETGLPCTSGYFTFLDCLDCGNAATVPRLLSRQLAALSVLDDLRDALGAAWERKFSRRYYLLKAITERHSAAEVMAASKQVQEHRPTIIAALRHERPV